MPYGGYFSTTLPSYIALAISTVQDERWKKVLMMRHNHEAAAKQATQAAVHIDLHNHWQVAHMHVSGVIGVADAPQAQYPKEFFESITFLDQPPPPPPHPPPPPPPQ